MKFSILHIFETRLCKYTAAFIAGFRCMCVYSNVSIDRFRSQYFINRQIDAADKSSSVATSDYWKFRNVCRMCATPWAVSNLKSMSRLGFSVVENTWKLCACGVSIYPP